MLPSLSVCSSWQEGFGTSISYRLLIALIFGIVLYVKKMWIIIFATPYIIAECFNIFLSHSSHTYLCSPAKTVGKCTVTRLQQK